MRTIFRLAMVALIAGVVIWWLSTLGGQSVTGEPSNVSSAILPSFAGLNCARVAVHYGRGAMYQMDGPLGMAPKSEINKWISMSRAEQVAFLESCQ